MKEDDLKKRLVMIEERRRNFDLEWNKLNEEERRLDSKKETILEKIFTVKNNNDNENSNKSNKNDELKMKYEIEKLKLEKNDLETKLDGMQKLLDKFYSHETDNSKHSKPNFENSHIETNHSNINNAPNENNDSDTEDSSKNSDQLISKIKAINSLNHSEVLKDSDDESEINELVQHAKLKLKLKYLGAKKKAQFDLSNKSDTVDDSDLDDSSNENLNDKLNHFVNNASEIENVNQELIENKKYLIENLNKEKNALEIANELLDRYKQTLLKRRVKLERAHGEFKKDETSGKLSNPLKLENRRLSLEKEELELEQLGLNIKSGKRLIKQKKFQLNLLEKNIKDSSILSDSDFSNNEDQVLSNIKNSEREETLFSLKNNDNLSGLIQSLKNSQSKNHLKSLYEQKIHPILKKIPSLNSNLEVMFENLNSRLMNESDGNKTNFNGMNSYKNLKNFNQDSSYIDEKWKKYLGDNLNSNKKSNYFQSTLGSDDLNSFRSENHFSNKKLDNYDSSRIINGTWEYSPAYHKLTLESGSRLLEEKWNQYVGNNFVKNSKSLKNFSQTLNSVNSARSTNNIDSRFDSTSITLTEQTKQRLKSHIDWLKKFKAEGDINSIDNN